MALARMIVQLVLMSTLATSLVQGERGELTSFGRRALLGSGEPPLVNFTSFEKLKASETADNASGDRFVPAKATTKGLGTKAISCYFPALCGPNAQCFINGGIQCICDLGYTRRNYQCVPPCSGVKCPANAECWSFNSTAFCVCRKGFKVVKGKCVRR